MTWSSILNLAGTVWTGFTTNPYITVPIGLAQASY
jgi:hypothetical protein